MCEEYWCLFYSPRTGLRDIHMGLRQLWGMFIFFLFALHGSEVHGSNISIPFIHLRQVWGIFIWVWDVCEEYSYLFDSPRMGLRDIHKGLRQVWGMCIVVLFASHRSEPHMSNIFISVTHIRQVWGIFIQVCARSEECLYLFCSPKAGLRDIHIGLSHGEKYSHPFYSLRTGLRHTHTGLRMVWGMFTFILFASQESEPRVRNIDICFIHRRQVWGIFIQVWGTCEQCW